MTHRPEQSLKIGIIVGEESGDQLGAALMDGLNRAAMPGSVCYCGVGGERMAALGLKSLFPLADISVMGITAVIAGLRKIIGRIRETADHILAENPDVLVIIDSPDFTHRVAKRVRKRRPDLLIIDYVSPSVWAWRPWRARAMTAYVDHILAILPFEPAVHQRLGGPACTYVGHPLSEKLDRLRGSTTERQPLETTQRPVLLVLPGSRRGEIERMMDRFGGAVGDIAARFDRPLDIVLPAVPHLAELIAGKLEDWPVKPTIILGEAEKLAAFRRAHAALATSGTVSLELALAGVPTVVAYVLDAVYRQVNRLRRVFPKIIQVDTMVLPNIILKEKAIPEFLDQDAVPKVLADSILPLLCDGTERDMQLKAFSRLDTAMRLADGSRPSDCAALIILSELNKKRAF